MLDPLVEWKGRLCGVDETGRGPLCGPVVAAAVVLDPASAAQLSGLDDSKRLSALQRERLAERIREHSLGWALGQASVEEIDAYNILQATFLAMERAVAALPADLRIKAIWIDGNCLPPFKNHPVSVPVHTLVKGDARMPAIAAASILAKTARDAQMIALDALYPEYGFAQHKGYPTPAHLDALHRHGVLPIHRRSCSPVARVLAATAAFLTESPTQ